MTTEKSSIISSGTRGGLLCNNFLLFLVAKGGPKSSQRFTKDMFRLSVDNCRLVTAGLRGDSHRRGDDRGVMPLRGW